MVEAVVSCDLLPMVVLAGPTASGKSAVALKLAERFGGTIVNADAMQVYADLRVLTARPNAAEERRAPHRLFGEIDAAENFSAGRWPRLHGHRPAVTQKPQSMTQPVGRRGCRC